MTASAKTALLHSLHTNKKKNSQTGHVDFSSSRNIIALENVVLAKRAGRIDLEPFDNACRMEMMVAWKCMEFRSIFIWRQTNTTFLIKRGGWGVRHIKNPTEITLSNTQLKLRTSISSCKITYVSYTNLSKFEALTFCLMNNIHKKYPNQI